MPVEIKKPCCAERTCQREQPIRLMRDAITGEWLIVTQYSEDQNSGVLHVFQQHRLDPRDAATLERLTAPPPSPRRPVVTVDLPVVATDTGDIPHPEDTPLSNSWRRVVRRTGEDKWH